jgi:hypothetical protein
MAEPVQLGELLAEMAGKDPQDDDAAKALLRRWQERATRLQAQGKAS